MLTPRMMRLGSLTVLAGGLTLGLLGCGPEEVKEAAPPPISGSEAIDPKRLEMMKNQSQGSGTSDAPSNAKPDSGTADAPKGGVAPPIATPK